MNRTWIASLLALVLSYNVALYYVAFWATVTAHASAVRSVEHDIADRDRVERVAVAIADGPRIEPGDEVHERGAMYDVVATERTADSLIVYRVRDDVEAGMTARFGEHVAAHSDQTRHSQESPIDSPMKECAPQPAVPCVIATCVERPLPIAVAPLLSRVIPTPAPPPKG